ncbi:CRISPR-associated primase-polymerase type A1 [Thermodesulfatator autotrophicus]|uniref:TOTE conflict system primase domain-containing protein n=1 Tax=Thermodesulfatator autotrophicus TaxID=1795632 RepID=A0A177E7C1_9BACT|nr:CRISPR-associated primase-polymerase type A1 [Thermodesulfatator autotrophicus]OAG26919.1 hypothetical protein TH606_09640 [Thermodesulfatator autotrophicus]
MKHLLMAEEYLAQGLEEKARALVLRYRLWPGQKADEYLRWGILCEELALPIQAIECYQKALEVEKNYPPALWALARLYYELGDLDTAKRLTRRFLQKEPENSSARELLAKIYEELGEAGSYAVITRQKEKPASGPRYFPPSLGKRDLEPFGPFLYGRKAYGEIVLNSTGAPVFLYREKAFDEEKLKEHLLGKRYFGVYPIDEENRTRVAFLAIRISEQDRARHARDKSWLHFKSEAVNYVALSAFKRVKDEGLSAALEVLSPYYYRLWFLFSEPIHFLWAKRFLKTLLNKLPYPEDGVLYQAWNLTKPVGLGWREQAVILPLGVNPSTRQRALFIDESGEPYPEQLSFFKKWRQLSFSEVKTFCRGGELRFEARTVKPFDELLSRLCEKCAVIDSLVRKAQAGRILTREEKLALFLTVGLLDQDGRLLHEVLHPCPDYHFSRVERQRKGLPPNPISCYKLRAWFPTLTTTLSCYCVFENAEERYPSPLLHVSPILVPPEEETLTLKHRSVAELARHYWFYLNEKEKLERRLANLEKELVSYLEARPGKRIRLAEKVFLYCEDGRLKLEKT